jgi:hypothetical protein
LDEGLYRRAKLEAALRGKQVSEILGEALERYLDEHRGPGRSLGVVEETWGSIAVPREELEEIMADEGWLDS